MAIRKDRVRLAFDEIGSQDAFIDGESAPIILLHGIASSKETWKCIMKPLAEYTNRKVYAFDARNHGDSGWSEHIDYEMMQDDLEEFMEGLHIKKAVLVGHSMGGKTASYFSLRKPGIVEKLIVEDALPTPINPKVTEQMKNYFGTLYKAVESIPPHINNIHEAKTFVAEFLRLQYSQKNVEASSLPLKKDQNGVFAWKANLKVIENAVCRGFKNPSALQGVYKGPTLILYGTKSPFYRKSDEDYVSNFFSKVIFKAVEGASHNIHSDNTDVFFKEVSNFINRARN